MNSMKSVSLVRLDKWLQCAMSDDTCSSQTPPGPNDQGQPDFATGNREALEEKRWSATLGDRQHVICDRHHAGAVREAGIGRNPIADGAAAYVVDGRGDGDPVIRVEDTPTARIPCGHIDRICGCAVAVHPVGGRKGKSARNTKLGEREWLVGDEQDTRPVIWARVAGHRVGRAAAARAIRGGKDRDPGIGVDDRPGTAAGAGGHAHCICGCTVAMHPVGG